MAKPDYRGARGSNAGDDFHELWALRQALTLLDQDTNLIAVTVEGLRAEDESGVPQDTWDGVDCTLYFGGDHIATAERIEICQLKYSAANPDQQWTVARLTNSTNKNQDNSVIGRLAKAFTGIQKKRSDLIANGNLVVRLNSNQQIDPGVFSALSSQGASDQSLNGRPKHQSDRATLVAASGLQNEDFEIFARALNLSECGQGSRFALEERVLTTISEWTDDDARLIITDLMRFMRRAMLPEAKGESITRHSILAQLGFSDSRALFPCPSEIKKVGQLIARDVSKVVVERMLSGKQRICLYGEAGCGKTTALQEIVTLLPPGSDIVIFDCYGGGRYLDSDAYRHRPQDAFLQLSNDLARQLRIPLLVSRSANSDYPKIFKKRLERAAAVVASKAQDALLVIVVDAADNSVTAATTHSPPDPSFIHDFVRLGDLPGNVRFITTCRIGRLQTLDLPRNYTKIEITGFTSDETTDYVRGIWNDAPDTWIDDFHYLSNGNPRVQRYALDYARAEPARALNYLRPNGKGLEEIFREQLEYTRLKVGHDQDIKNFCSGLIALPRPIPIIDLSAVTDLSDTYIRDLCSDLAPGIRVTNESVGFADEDFEQFIRTETETQLDLIHVRIADHFVTRHKSDAYAASHLAAALLAAGRRQEIIDLIKSEREPTAIGDPVLRREAQSQRLRIAMKVCRETGNNVDAMLTLLIGAEALKTDVVIRRMLIENPDLAANFARDASSRIVLRNPDEIENHGLLLFHLMAADARNGHGISVREVHRQVQAWLQRRAQNFKNQESEHPNTRPLGWDISAHDIAAETEAILRIAGPRRAVDGLLRWHPKFIALQVASILSFKLIILGEADLVERCITEARIPTPWDLFLLTPLALAGKEVDLQRLESSLASLHRRRLIRPNVEKSYWRDDNPTADSLEMILTACEVIIARGRDRTRVIPVLELIASQELRRRDRLSTSNVSLIDFSLRAYALLERLAGRKATLETFWINPPDPPEGTSPKDVERLKKSDNEKKEELQGFIGPLVDIYDVRAQALVGLISLEEIGARIREAINQYHSKEYRLSNSPYASAMKARVALSITRLMALSGLDRSSLLECARAVLGSRSNYLGSNELQVFTSIAMDRALHSQILSLITAQAKTVKKMKTSAEDKLESLTLLARFLLPISYGDAGSLFNDAFEVAGEINADAVHEIALFAPYAEKAVDGMGDEERRAAARDLAIIFSDAGVRLAGIEGFPWEKTAQALATMDFCLALAATARWEDSNIIDHDRFLPPILETALSRHEITPMQVSALSPLLDQFSIDLISRVVNDAIGHKGNPNLDVLAEHLAQEELLRFGKGVRQQVSEKLGVLSVKVGHGYWMSQLAQATKFHQLTEPDKGSTGSNQEEWRQKDGGKTEQPDPFVGIDWTTHRFISEHEVNDVIERVFTATRAADTYVSASTILDRMRGMVALGDRASHLEALSRSKTSRMIDNYELTRAIAKCVDEWYDAPSITRWCRKRLIQVITDRLPDFSRWLAYERSPLPNLIEKSGTPGHQVYAALLDAIERYVDALDAPTIYALVGLIGRYCTPDDAGQIIARYADRLVQRIPIPERDTWDLADIPTDAASGIARFLYALMGDVDVRIRWRAAHALRCLARLGETGTLDKLIEIYSRTTELSYRRPDAPFYWLAARLWLIIALDRIAAETPSAVKRYGLRLLEIATDEKFPHVLLRSFAKSAVCKTVESGNLVLNPTQRDALKRVNTSPVHRKKARKSHNVGFDKYGDQGRKDRRFQFDSMDTLPYWYSGMLRAFADVSGEEFLVSAEHWIVDCWGVQSDPWQWNDEPRRDRLSDRFYVSMDHRHGSMPTLERFHTYLEWHAMWCATGELIQSRALAKNEEDDYYAFEHQLSRDGLTLPPLWLSDLHGPKPLEYRLWFAPKDDINAWLENASGDDFLAELGLAGENRAIIVGSSHETRSHDFVLSVQVHTALVSPETASSLVRALQTVDDPWDYRIPPAGDELEIDNPPYKLVGWLEGDVHDLGIDEHDPLRYRGCAIKCLPSRETATALNLMIVGEEHTSWIEANRRETIFVYEAWGDNCGDEREDRHHYDTSVRSSGWHLRVDREALRTFLDKMDFDLIAEIEITRRNTGYDDYSRYDEEKAKETRYDRVVLLRRDGTIEAAEGCIGTW